LLCPDRGSNPRNTNCLFDVKKQSFIHSLTSFSKINPYFQHVSKGQSVTKNFGHASIFSELRALWITDVHHLDIMERVCYIRWGDNDVHIVLDQHVYLDFIVLTEQQCQWLRILATRPFSVNFVHFELQTFIQTFI
jgi:hypothetical protein